MSGLLRAGPRNDPIRTALVAGATIKLATVAMGVLNLGIAARALSPEEFGMVAIFVSVAFFFGLLDLGTSSAVLNRLSTELAIGDLSRARTIYATQLRLLCSVCATSTVLSALILLETDDAMASRFGVSVHVYRQTAVAFVVVAGAQVFNGFANKILTAHQRGDLNAYVIFYGSLSSGVMCFAGNLGGAPPAWYLISLLLPTTIASCVGILRMMVHTFSGILVVAREPFSSGELRALLASGWPYLTIALVAAAAFQTDTLVVGSVLGAREAAVFALSARMFASITSLYAIGIQQVWGTLAPSFAEGNLNHVRRVMATWGTFVVVTSALLSALLLVFGRSIVDVWAGPKLVPSWSLLAVLAFWCVYVVAMSLLGAVLNAAGRVRGQAVAGVFMALVTVPLSILLARELGPEGPVLASLVCHATIVAPVVLVSLRRSLRSPGPSVRPAVLEEARQEQRDP